MSRLVSAPVADRRANQEGKNGFGYWELRRLLPVLQKAVSSGILIPLTKRNGQGMESGEAFDNVRFHPF